MGFVWLRNWNHITYNINLIGDYLQLENYLKIGKKIITTNIVEENFIKDSKANLVGFEIGWDVKVLQMFANTYELVASTRKGLLHINEHFSYNAAPFEYVFKIDDQFFGIFFTINDGIDYKYKCSIIKNGMTLEEAVKIIKKLGENYVKHIKILQENMFKKGKKVLDDVILPNGLKQSILIDIENFLKSRKRYEEFGMVWKRGYIFHGSPGNGKTLFLRKLGLAFGLNMRDMIREIGPDGTLNLPLMDDPYYENSALNLAKMATGQSDDTPPEIFYLEDMDKVIGKNENDFAKITLSDFLTALDGVSRLANGIIIIGTTNYIDRMENSILGRPGRFDRIYEFPKPTKTEILKFFEWRNFLIKDKKTTDHYSDIMVKKNFSMAFVEDFVLAGVTKTNHHKISTSYADSLIKDLELYNKLEIKTGNIGFAT